MSMKNFVWPSVLTILLILSAQSLSLLAAGSPSVALPQIKLIATDPTALEKVSSGAFTFIRSGPSNAALTVNYVIGGTASNGVNYVQISTNITIPVGKLSADLLIQPIDDKRDEGNRTVILTLATNVNYKLATTTGATVTIVDNNFNNLPPTVAITSPTNKAVFAFPANVVIKAEAGDVDDGVAKVSFYDGDNFLGFRTNQPYSLTWSNVPPGAHTLFARAVDNLGESTLSAAVHISISNIPPTVNLTSPTNLAIFHAGTNIMLAATASDPDDAIAKVSFYSGSKLLGTVTNKPYSLIWSNVPPGKYSISAGATDVGGASASSKQAAISVTNTVPIVRLVAPTDGTIFPFPASIKLTAEASDSGGKIAKVSFYSAEKLLGSVTNPPYSLTWSNVPLGSYSLLARAVDQFGTIGTSMVARVIVSNPPPVVAFATPTNGSVFAAQSNISISVAASDPDGISKLTLSAGSRVLGTFTKPPYSLIWSNVAGGTYVLSARATDGVGETGVAYVNITVMTSSNAVPQVTLTSPTNGAAFAAGSNIKLAASASASNDTITKVAFYNGNSLLGFVTNKPYSLVWSNVPTGNYSLSARAAAVKGGVVNSKPVYITVTNSVPPVTNSAPVVRLISPTNGAIFGVSEKIKLLAEATNVNKSITRVSFYANTQLLGTVTNQPYALIWSNVTTGSYQIIARAVDALGKPGYSTPITIQVTNAAPTVSLTSPTNNAYFVAPAKIVLTAKAADVDDAVIGVAFYYGGTHLIGYRTNAPFTLTWTNVPAGKYTLEAQAMDAGHNDTWSDSVHITVTPSTAATAAIGSVGSDDIRISSVEKLGSGVTEVGVEAPADATVLLESSSDLADWQAVATMLVRDGVGIFVDSAPADGKLRFYRAKRVQ